MMLGKRVLAPLSYAESIEGNIAFYDEESGKVSVITDEQETFVGYEYQLEFLD